MTAVPVQDEADMIRQRVGPYLPEKQPFVERIEKLRHYFAGWGYEPTASGMVMKSLSRIPLRSDQSLGRTAPFDNPLYPWHRNSVARRFPIDKYVSPHRRAGQSVETQAVARVAEPVRTRQHHANRAKALAYRARRNRGPDRRIISILFLSALSPS